MLCKDDNALKYTKAPFAEVFQEKPELLQIQMNLLLPAVTETELSSLKSRLRAANA